MRLFLRSTIFLIVLFFANACAQTPKQNVDQPPPWEPPVPQQKTPSPACQKHGPDCGFD